CLCPAIDKPAWYAALHQHQNANVEQLGHHLFPVPADGAPGWRELLEDAALLAGATVLVRLGKAARQGAPRRGVARCGLTADRFIIHQSAVESPQRFRQHYDVIRAEIESTEDAERQEWLCRRLARLTDGVVEILVHGASPEEGAHLYDLAT